MGQTEINTHRMACLFGNSLSNYQWTHLRHVEAPHSTKSLFSPWAFNRRDFIGNLSLYAEVRGFSIRISVSWIGIRYWPDFRGYLERK